MDNVLLQREEKLVGRLKLALEEQINALIELTESSEIPYPAYQSLGYSIKRTKEVLHLLEDTISKTKTG
jgi:hypothetical protein